MKIKRKVEMNLPQLIEWAKENEIKDKMFLTKNSYCVGFDRHGFIYFNSISTMPLDQLFTVEVEEEINECSDIKRLAHYTVHGFTSNNFNKSIGELRKSTSLAFYIMNDDRTLTLIWTKEKGLVV